MPHSSGLPAAATEFKRWVACVGIGAFACGYSCPNKRKEHRLKSEKKAHHLSIFLIKPAYTTISAIVDVAACESPISIEIQDYGYGHLFIKRSPPIPPKWSSLFEGQIDLSSIKVPGLSAVLAIEVGDRWFALAFGHGGRFLIRDGVFEERFGLLCALNSVDPKTFRCVDVQSLDAIQSHSRIQSGFETTPDQFGLDVEQDMLKAIVGAPVNAKLGSRMTGSDSLTVNVKMELSDLPFLLDEYRKQFEADLDAKNHQWVNNISLTKNVSLTAALEATLDAKLAARTFDNIWLSIPEIIEWTTVVGFMYSKGHQEVHPDINLQGFLKTVESDTSVSLDLLRKQRVFCADADFKPTFKSWSVAKCLYAEVDYDGGKYILSDGKWFSVNSDFVAKTNSDYSKIPRSTLNLPLYTGGGEGKYNASVAASEPTRYALLDDKKKVMHGGGHGQVEICDLFSIDRQLIHVKLYGKSSVFSHLFAQGFVSGQLIQIDPEFRKKVRRQLNTPFADLIHEDKKPVQDELTIIFAVITEEAGGDLHLPFFSRVNLNNTAKILKGFGYKIEVLKIAVDDIYSKTTMCPPSKKGKNASKSAIHQNLLLNAERRVEI